MLWLKLRNIGYSSGTWVNVSGIVQFWNCLNTIGKIYTTKISKREKRSPTYTFRRLPDLIYYIIYRHRRQTLCKFSFLKNDLLNTIPSILKGLLFKTSAQMCCKTGHPFQYIYSGCAVHKCATSKEALFISGTHINIGGHMGHCGDSAYQLSPGSSGRNPSLHKLTLEHMITTHLGDRIWTHSANICVQLCPITNSHWVFSEVTFLTSLVYYSVEFSFPTQHHPSLTCVKRKCASCWYLLVAKVIWVAKRMEKCAAI